VSLPGAMNNGVFVGQMLVLDVSGMGLTRDQGRGLLSLVPLFRVNGGLIKHQMPRLSCKGRGIWCLLTDAGHVKMGVPHKGG
jgi:hypothetical protein